MHRWLKDAQRCLKDAQRCLFGVSTAHYALPLPSLLTIHIYTNLHRCYELAFLPSGTPRGRAEHELRQSISASTEWVTVVSSEQDHKA